MSAGLTTYRSKRDFGLTPEPSGTRRLRKPRAKAPVFVVQKHAATHLHYDFRLEVAGVLKSWAVPKGPSAVVGEKRLAVQTEDHPLDYADFEGDIPAGEYGGGTVQIWDAGAYRNLKRDREDRPVSMEGALSMGQVEIWLEGRRLRGGYVLVHSRLGGNDKNWLLIRMKDATAERLLVLSERNALEEVGAGRKPRAAAEGQSRRQRVRARTAR